MFGKFINNVYGIFSQLVTALGNNMKASWNKTNTYFIIFIYFNYLYFLFLIFITKANLLIETSIIKKRKT